jgi:subtilisin family serine protease
MRAQRNSLICLTAVATLVLASADGAFAQKMFEKTNRSGAAPHNSAGKNGRFVSPKINASKTIRGASPIISTSKNPGASPNVSASRQPTPSGPRGGGYQGGGYNSGRSYGGRYYGGGYYRGGGWGPAGPGVLMADPQAIPPGGQFVDDGAIDNGAINGVPQSPRQPPQQTARRGPSGAPPANERRLVPDEVVIEVSNSVSAQTIDELQRRHRLTRIEFQTLQLSGTTLYRWRIPDRRSVAGVVRALEADNVVASAQPNYLFTLQQDAVKTEGDPAQYELAKLHLPQAHSIAKGDNILVAIIDSGIDASHPELSGAVADTFNTIGTQASPHKHGTAIAGLVVAHGKLMGSAPGARILGIRAFDPAGASAEGSTFNILKGLDWAAANGARVINMSFAGPSDPAIHRSLEAAHKRGIVLVAAAGNQGPKSPPLYPAADPNVIAVTATDADDKLFELSNRGRHIAVAAPGAQILVAIPDGGYEVSSGTSYSAAEVSGIIALMLERKGDITPDQVRGILLATARDLGPKGPDIMFGAGLADAYGAIMAEAAPLTAATPRPVERVSTGAR